MTKNYTEQQRDMRKLTASAASNPVLREEPMWSTAWPDLDMAGLRLHAVQERVGTGNGETGNSYRNSSPARPYSFAVR